MLPHHHQYKNRHSLTPDINFSVIGQNAKTWDKYKHRAFTGRDDNLPRAELDTSQAKLKTPRMQRTHDSVARELQNRLEYFRQQLTDRDRWEYTRNLWAKGKYSMETAAEADFLRRLLRRSGITFDTLQEMCQLGICNIIAQENPANAAKIIHQKTDQQNVVGYNQLGDILDFPELFQAYPQLKTLPIRWMNENFRYRGVYTTGGRFSEPFIALYRYRNPGGKLSTILHEVQHWIQHHENFAYGALPGSPRDFLRRVGHPAANDPGNLYRRFAGEIESRNVQARRWLSPEERLELPFNDTLEYPGQAISYSVPQLLELNFSVDAEELTHRFNTIRQAPPISIDNPTAFQPDIKAAIKTAREQYRKHQNNPVTMKDGKVVHFSNTGFHKIKSHAADRRSIAVIPQLRDLCKSAEYMYSARNSEEEKANKADISQYHYYLNKASFNGFAQDAYFLIAVAERTNGEFFYDLDATDIETIENIKGTTDTLAATRVPNTGRQGGVPKGRLHNLKEFVNNYQQNLPLTPEQARQLKANNEPQEPFVNFSLRTKAEPKKKGIGYKVFYQKDGKLYPPMVANPGGTDTPIGVWLDADEGERAGESKTGRPQVKAGGRGTQGGSGTLAYRPGWHLGKIPYALQFNRKNPITGERDLFPADFVWAEVEYAADVDYQEEAMSYGITKSGKFQHSLAGLPKLPTDGYYEYRTNPNPQTDPWIITGAMKVNRILSREQVNQLVIAAGRKPQKVQGDIPAYEALVNFSVEPTYTVLNDNVGLQEHLNDIVTPIEINFTPTRKKGGEWVKEALDYYLQELAGQSLPIGNTGYTLHVKASKNRAKLSTYNASSQPRAKAFQKIKEVIAKAYRIGSETSEAREKQSKERTDRIKRTATFERFGYPAVINGEACIIWFTGQTKQPEDKDVLLAETGVTARNTTGATSPLAVSSTDGGDIAPATETLGDTLLNVKGKIKGMPEIVRNTPETNFSLESSLFSGELQNWQRDPIAALGQLGTFSSNIQNKLAAIGTNAYDTRVRHMQEALRRRIKELQHLKDGTHPNEQSLAGEMLAIINQLHNLLPHGYRFGLEPYIEFATTYAKLHTDGDPDTASVKR